jgi:hypothetical protein
MDEKTQKLTDSGRIALLEARVALHRKSLDTCADNLEDFLKLYETLREALVAHHNALLEHEAMINKLAARSVPPAGSHAVN